MAGSTEAVWWSLPLREGALSVQGTAPILGTSGKLIKSTGEDRVFVYFADHGAPGVRCSAEPAWKCKTYLIRCVTNFCCSAAGILGMPTGPFLYADQLIGTLRNKSASKYVLYALFSRRILLLIAAYR